MKLVPRKYFLLFLAALLVVALAYMGFTLYNQRMTPKTSTTTYEKELQQMQNQSQSDGVDDIEKDLTETDLSDIDKELQDIETELNQATY
ncbi:hypothetical protein A2714_02765 [Candidatus Woesebacteria bacterium RIFCSPHIGHO2_01_FULL_38_9]|uniref:Uncharacterized protein n=2 Tax=Candidatus Woeseibacteriota TaxID=1752722 RepID=A0A1F7XZW6_9BACT|nr:MAG: hypothetical protein A2714_02765 [Candidatus Woesebacteria bacterium RIFCSPHIGHO2_01_FULL_38_9]OGM58704.1 MAG: hypothetical protein A3A75_00555 [Candidatus Woesebacteria bacterium RIFCSPLOWO2_01_FULL_39_10]